jgi:D-tyrosyl-tRNA(Tyr) deacylase
MKTVVQRVSEARVRVAGARGDEIVGEIEVGLVALVGVEKGDTEADAVATAQKLAGLRVFRNPDDPNKPIDRSLADVGGACLVISQFTVPGRVRKGRRPSFDRAEHPDRAQALYTRVAEELRALGVPTQTGRFAADMQVALVNDGPVTLLLFARDGQVVDAE